MKQWTLEVQQQDDDYIIELPPDLLEDTGWQTGDTLEWIDNKNGSWTLRKKDECSTLHNGV